MTTQEKNSARAHLIAEYMTALDDRNGHRAHLDKVMCPLRKVVDAERRGTLTVQSGSDPALIDSSTEPYALRIPSHTDVVAAVVALRDAAQRVTDARVAVDRAGINLGDLAAG